MMNLQTKSGCGSRRQSSPRRWLLGVILALAPAVSASGQMFNRARPTVITNARIVTLAGEPIENGQILIRGGMIVGVGDGLELPGNADVIDAGGATVTPGLIDVHGLLGLASPSGSDAMHDVEDAFDPYDIEAFHDAFRNGVTTVYATPVGGSGVNGTGAVMRLVPRPTGGYGETLVDEAALHVNMGSDSGPLVRLNIYAGLQRQFKNALDHRDALETYEEELEEYLEKIEERAKKEAAEGGEKAEGKNSNGNGNGGGNGSGSANGQPSGRRGPGGRGGGGRGGIDSSDEFAFNDDDTQPRPRRRPRQEPPQQPQQPEQGEKKKNEADEDGIKKPAEPGPNPAADLLLKCIDGDLVIRVRAERDTDLLNAIDLAEQYGLKIIIEGGSDAHLVASQLADAEIPVILGSTEAPMTYGTNARSRRSPHVTSVLNDASVDWVVGSGATSGSLSRFILMNAQVAARHAGDDTEPLELVTADAADFLGVADRIGRITRGRAADLVMWSGDPNDAGSRVMRVFVNGTEVYTADEAGGGQ